MVRRKVAVQLTLTSGLAAGAIGVLQAHEGHNELPDGERQFRDSSCSQIITSDDGVPARYQTRPGMFGACGSFGPLIATHVTAVHSGLVWESAEAESPYALSFFRFPNFSSDDVAAPEVTQELIDAGALQDPENNFNAALRRSFQGLVYGGYNIVQGLSQSVPTRLHVDRARELTQLWDLGHPDAFANTGEYFVALLDDADAEANDAAFTDAGHSAGLQFNLYCAGHSTLSTGEVVYAGGHDMNSNNGLYGINVFDPSTRTWRERAPGVTRKNWMGASAQWLGMPDPYHQDFFQDLVDTHGCDVDPNQDVCFFEGKNPSAWHSEWPRKPAGGTATQPDNPGDMRYARWYPTVMTLPDDRVLILSGTDQDERVGPSPGAEIDPSTSGVIHNEVDGSTSTVPLTNTGMMPRYRASDQQFRDSNVLIIVPEVYDPRTDTTVALENARMVFPVYPQAFVVRTGPAPNDWKVAVMNGNTLAEFPGEQIDGALRSQGNSHEGNMYLLDVHAALADPKRDEPAENHWTFIDQTPASHGPYFAHAELVDVDRKGRVTSHKVMFFGGGSIGQPTDTISMIDLAAENPRFVSSDNGEIAPLLQPAATTHATPLPDGKVLIAGGVALRDENGNLNEDFEARNSLRYQLFDPITGTISELAKTSVPRFIHGTLFLLPDATVLTQGDDRTNAVQAGDAIAPQGDHDLGVPTAQVWYPYYLFDDNDMPAVRPEIISAPSTIKYGGAFQIDVASDSHVQSVVMQRSAVITHSLSMNYTHVNMNFKALPDGTILVFSPRDPVPAVAGDYVIYVVDDNGVPSEGKHVRLGPASSCQGGCAQ